MRINPYEIMLLIEPEVAEERQREIIERIQQTVEKGGGSWKAVEPWGRRKLAYEIRHLGEAWYYVLAFDAEAPVLQEITRVLAITDGVLRFMATKRIPGSSPAKPADGRADAIAEEPVEAGA
jgi:small subunit ribosomal protein S6